MIPKMLQDPTSLPVTSGVPALAILKKKLKNLLKQDEGLFPNSVEPNLIQIHLIQ